MKNKIELDIECQSCDGTGVYQGMAESEGAGVICHRCDGTGCFKYKFEYTPFTERKLNNNISRVFLSGYGFCIGTKPIKLDNGTFVDFSKEGVQYKEFLNGKMPKHIRHMGCPMMADQGACHKIEGFVDECNKLHGGYINYIPGCKCPDKMGCWDRFEKQSKEKVNE